MTGIPLAVKDNICHHGCGTSACSNALRDHRPTYDADVVTKLRGRGAILLGRTNMDEFGMGSTTETSANSPTLNPWNTGHVPGGSSGGSAAAVSAQLCVGALGTDTGGSIRQPSAFCGVVGLKPTYGAVSRHGLISYCSSFDTIGPIASSVEDVACIFESIRCTDEERASDSTSAPWLKVGSILPSFDDLCSRPLQNKRFGVIAEALGPGTSSTVKESFVESVRQIESLGGTVDLISCETFHTGLPAYYVLALSQASSNLARYDGIRFGGKENMNSFESELDGFRGSALGEEVRRRILMGTYMLSAGYSDEYYARAKFVQQSVCAEMRNYLSTYDALLTPATPTTAYNIGNTLADPLQMYVGDMTTVNVNLAGLPALVVRSLSRPDHSEDTYLPTGLQLIGSHFGEKELLEVGHVIEVCSCRNGREFPDSQFLQHIL